MYNTTHYTALMNRLSEEKRRVSIAGKDKELRQVWVRQIEKEIEQEAEFLKSKGVDIYQATSDNAISDEDLLNELFGE